MWAHFQKASEQPWLRWGLRGLLAALVALVMSYLPYRLVEGKSEEKLERMRVELARVQQEIAEAEADVLARRRQVGALKNDTRTIENIAREELHMLYPHEKSLKLSKGQR